MRYACIPPHLRAVLSLVGWALLVGCLAVVPRVQAGGLYRWVDAQGQVHLTDSPPPATREQPGLTGDHPGVASPSAAPQETPAAGATAPPVPAPHPGGLVVEAVLNRRLTVPLRLDAGAEVTVLTKRVAEGLGMTGLNQWPTHPFHTAGGMVNFPITSLRSLRVGSAEARDVNVAIDTEGRLPVGLLGQTFLRRFKMTVDPQSGQVTFDR